ncbi:recombinase zinc beta ribbon domain-containing protein [Pseudomonas sp. GL-B-16]|uniref:recombinase zinc beta ribbon domain-containing protein n=1 Tax=Pseudomonas sp. GL-B-16 TaxID=2832373 RepID=UPI0029586568|nr:recombinase zinc beta ribbon domain-containing protein [Pseudomonas sp. GL-B-16]
MPKKGYSTVRTDPSHWVEIPVPAIISEGLFKSVQEQLAENRRAARQRRNGAVYLLQSLTVSGHCHYAYYGKKISKTAAKGQRRDSAYYRCSGTDAYSFGGERICDNQQIRTGCLDELVWQQVVELLAHPEQLDQQIQESRRHQTGQRELFLVINRLEEFAAAVHDRLDTVNFVTKREIIRGLVKRVEIHKDEVVVVFRVDPDPGFDVNENSTDSDIGAKSMEDCSFGRRNPP